MALPTWNRSRTKKRGEGVAPGVTDDAFQGAVRQAGKAAASRGRWVVLGLLVTALGIGGAVLWRVKSSSKSSAATQLLGEAAAYEARGRVGDVAALVGPTSAPPFPVVADEAARTAAIDKALADLDALAPKSGPALAADLVRGAAFLRDGAFVEAEEAYWKLLKEEPGHPLAFLAREGVALAREGRGDVDGALAELRTLAADKGALYREAALYHQARLLAANGRKDEAIAVLKTYVEEYPLQEASLMRDQLRPLIEDLEDRKSVV